MTAGQRGQGVSARPHGSVLGWLVEYPFWYTPQSTSESRPTPETNISIADVTLARLRELTSWAGISIDEALDRAIKDQYDRKFWDTVNAGYAAQRADPEAWAAEEAERSLWDATLMDGLDSNEHWTKEGQRLALEDKGR